MSVLQSRECSRFEGLRFAFAFHSTDTLSPPLPLALAFSAVINATTSFCRGVSWVCGFTGAAAGAHRCLARSFFDPVFDVLAVESGGELLLCLCGIIHPF